MKDIKQEYINVLNSGFFWELFPHLTGDWNEDKESFIEIMKDVKSYMQKRKEQKWQ
jgi:hypothetical protein